MSSVALFPRVDADGNALAVGDSVLVLAAPADLAKSPPDTQVAFSRAVGQVIPIQGFNEYGFVELEMTPPRFRNWDSIWMEPFLLRKVGWSLVRRYRPSKNKGPQRSKVVRLAELRRNRSRSR
jgi:hypothetical protein